MVEPVTFTATILVFKGKLLAAYAAHRAFHHAHPTICKMAHQFAGRLAGEGLKEAKRAITGEER